MYRTHEPEEGHQPDSSQGNFPTLRYGETQLPLISHKHTFIKKARNKGICYNKKQPDIGQLKKCPEHPLTYLITLSPQKPEHLN